MRGVGIVSFMDVCSTSSSLQTGRPHEGSPSPARRHPPRRRRNWHLGIVVILLIAGIAISGLPRDFVLWRASVCIEARKHDRAIAWLQTVKWIFPDNSELHYLLARANRRIGRFDEVHRHLKRASELGWPRAKLEREQWLALAQTGQFAAMQDHWRDLFLNAGSDGPEICRAFVIGALKQFRIADATNVISGWKVDFPDDPEPYFYEAQIAGVALRWQDAEIAYREALRRASDRLDFREGLIDALMKQLKYSDAEVELQRLLAKNPSNVGARVRRADCLMRSGSLDESIDELRKILQATPDHYDALVLFGQIATSDGRTSEAVRALERAVQQRPEDAEVRYLYGKALRAAGREAEAAEHFGFREAAREPLLRLSKATNELVGHPRNLALRYEVGELTWRWKSHDEGAIWLLSLLELDPLHQQSHALLARHRELKGETNRADHHRSLAGSAEFHE